MKLTKLTIIIPSTLLLLIVALLIGSQFAGTVSRKDMTLNLDMGNNDGQATPVVYDSSGFGRHATAANAQTCTDTYCDFNGSYDYMTLTGTGVYNTTNVSIALKFTPDQDWDYNALDYFFDSTNNSRYYAYKNNNTNNNVLRIGLGNTVIEDIASSVYAPYWKQGEENILIIRGTTGNTDAWLNGNAILTDDSTGWVPKDPAQIFIGSVYSGVANQFEGKIHYFKTWQRLLTDDEVQNLSADRKMNISAPQRNELVGYWTMDANDVNGTTVYNKSGQGNHGTLYNGAEIASGKIKQAEYQSARNKYIKINGDSSPSSALMPTNAITVSAWVRADELTDQAPNTFSMIMTTVDSAAMLKGYLLFWHGNSFKFAVNGWNINVATCPHSKNLAGNGLWYNVVGTYNKDAGSNQVNIFVNGVKGTPDTYSSAIDYSGTIKTRIGNDYDYNSYDWVGKIDDVRIYNYALSAQEVSNLYNSAKSVYITAPSRKDLSGFWDMGNNDGQATPVVYDSSGFGRHATAANAQTCTDTYCDFNGSDDYMTLTGTNVYNTANVSIALKFTPDFATDEDVGRRFITSTDGAEYRIQKFNNVSANSLGIYLGDTAVATISEATYRPYWKQNEENVLIIRGTTGNTDAWLNGNAILTNDSTAWSPANPTSIYVGSSYNGSAFFDGKIHYLKIWNRLLTDQEVRTLSDDRKVYFR